MELRLLKTLMKEVRAWAREVGIVSSRPSWSSRLALETHGDTPPRHRSREITRFSLDVVVMGMPRFAHDSFWVVVWHEGNCFSYSGHTQAGGARARSLNLSRPKLATIRAWLRRVEKKLGVTFRRDRPLVHCTAKGGTKAIVDWISH